MCPCDTCDTELRRQVLAAPSANGCQRPVITKSRRMLCSDPQPMGGLSTARPPWPTAQHWVPIRSQCKWVVISVHVDIWGWGGDDAGGGGVMQEEKDGGSRLPL